MIGDVLLSLFIAFGIALVLGVLLSLSNAVSDSDVDSAVLIPERVER